MTMNEIQNKLKNMVVMVVSNDQNLQELTIDKNIDEVKGLPMFASLTQQEVDEIRAEIKSEFSIKLEKGVLIKENNHEKWFLAKKSTLKTEYWERYKKYLLLDKEFSAKVVNTMDDVLDTLTDLLGDPSRSISFARKGLIIGDVQSGKTANYIGLICKAVDSGYKVIVLLTGTIERLRQQTQQRIDEGFVGANSDAIMKQQDDRVIIGVGKYDPSIRPMCLTSTTDDFKQQNARNLNFDLRNINGPVVFVVKKNSAVLKRLNKWLRTFNQNGDQPINHSLLVIDDEADNASVNTKSEDEPTAINGQIRLLLNMFTKSSYVGFTATPFANIFIDPDSFNDMAAQDLFPRDYIYSLNAPSNYIGARNIFGDEGSNVNMLVEINDDDQDVDSIASILPLRHKSSIQVRKIPKDLKEAVCAFLLINTLEDMRGISGNHRSMLVNVSRFTAVQELISDLINDLLKNLQSACRLYSKLTPEAALKDPSISMLNDVFIGNHFDNLASWEDVQRGLYSSCAGIIVQTINQRNGKNLQFSDYKDGLRLIAVGGMSLSRGLTLEGLVVSYFYRNSRMYDTLMQMGRWFGYRKGYADLCRIWMSEESIEWYRHINNATDELREEIKRYEDSGLTPMEFGLRVRSDLTALIVTARNKMRSAESRECLISLSGECIETPEIFSDCSKNDENIHAIKTMIKEIESSGLKLVDKGRKNKVKWGFSNVPVRYILDFLEQINVSPKNEEFNVSAVASFVRSYRGDELLKWDIEFASGSGEDSPVDILGEDRTYYPHIRSFSIENDGKILKMSGGSKRLGSVNDALFGISDSDIERVRERKGEGKTPAQKDYFNNVERNPLLIIYIVGLKKALVSSTGVGEEHIREEEKKYLGREYVGFGIGIPGLSDQETKYARYILNKIAIQNIFEGEMDEWNGEDEED